MSKSTAAGVLQGTDNLFTKQIVATNLTDERDFLRESIKILDKQKLDAERLSLFLGKKNCKLEYEVLQLKKEILKRGWTIPELRKAYAEFQSQNLTEANFEMFIAFLRGKEDAAI